MAESPSLPVFRFARDAWRNSPWVVIAVMSHVIVGAVVSILSWRAETNAFVPEAIVIDPFARANPPPELPPEEPPIERTPLPVDEESELVTLDEAIFQYDPTTVRELTEPIGDPDAEFDPRADVVPTTSTTIGAGDHGGIHGRTGTHPPRPGIDGSKPGGGPLAPPQATQDAVLYGMRWLVRHQQEDGSWSIARLAEVCADPSCRASGASYGPHYDEGLTALALLAFLGAGYGHDAKQLIVDDVKGVQHRLGEVVKNGLRWLVDRQKEDGSFSAEKPYLYNEALCTMALCEAYWLTGARAWRAPAERAVAFLVAAQKRSPRGNGFWGWRYAPREDVTVTDLEGDAEALRAVSESDLSVTTWAIMAFKSAQLAGLDVPQENLDGAIEFVRWVSRSDGRAGYLTPDGAGLAIGGVNEHFTYHAAVMSALSMCARTFLVHDGDDPFLDAGARQLARDLPTVSADKLSVDYYYWYYGSLALNQFDGPDSPKHTDKYWAPWNRAMAQTVVALQDRDPGRCSHGGWLVPDRWSYTGGPVYATALNVLTLEVYYRYDNAFGLRDERAPTTTRKTTPGRR